MTKKEAARMLREAVCDDPYCCPFNLIDYDKEYETICKSTDPPFEFYKRTEETCPFLLKVADMLDGKPRNVQSDDDSGRIILESDMG